MTIRTVHRRELAARLPALEEAAAPEAPPPAREHMLGATAT
jgi:hypothetical protein